MNSQRDGLYIGLMTGTSLDGVDAALVDIQQNNIRLVDSLAAPLPTALLEQIRQLCQPGDNEIDLAGQVSIALSQYYADACLALLTQQNIRADSICAIGCHGQTVRHRPEHHFSIQLGCADTLATRTGIPVVSNFRNKDMALGGQGAPLVPPFHQQSFQQHETRVAVINIGGIANVSLLDGTQLLGGFDTGPGNILMDYWAQQHTGKPYDDGGCWAAAHTCDDALLARCLDDKYFQLPAPKSTGREHFNAQWLHSQLAGSENAGSVQTTLAELTAKSIAQSLSAFAPERIIVCGGGAHNEHLMARLTALTGVNAESSSVYGLDPDWVEAAAFAWLAWARMNHKPSNAPCVTGASRPAILGSLTLP